MLIAAAVGVAIAWFKDRDRVVVGLAVAALAWVVLVVAMVVAGYPGLERFFLPAAGIFCVLAGVGVARVAGFAGGGLATVGIAALLVAVSIPLATSRIDTARAQKGIADRAVRRLDELSASVRAVGGPGTRFPVPFELHGGQPRCADRVGLETPRNAWTRGHHAAPSGPQLRRPARLDRRRAGAGEVQASPGAADRPRRKLACLSGDAPGRVRTLRRRLSPRTILGRARLERVAVLEVDDQDLGDPRVELRAGAAHQLVDRVLV